MVRGVFLRRLDGLPAQDFFLQFLKFALVVVVSVWPIFADFFSSSVRDLLLSCTLMYFYGNVAFLEERRGLWKRWGYRPAQFFNSIGAKDQILWHPACIAPSRLLWHACTEIHHWFNSSVESQTLQTLSFYLHFAMVSFHWPWPLILQRHMNEWTDYILHMVCTYMLGFSLRPAIFKISRRLMFSFRPLQWSLVDIRSSWEKRSFVLYGWKRFVRAYSSHRKISRQFLIRPVLFNWCCFFRGQFVTAVSRPFYQPKNR